MIKYVKNKAISIKIIDILLLAQTQYLTKKTQLVNHHCGNGHIREISISKNSMWWTYPKVPVQCSILHVFSHNHGMFDCTHTNTQKNKLYSGTDPKQTRKLWEKLFKKKEENSQKSLHLVTTPSRRMMFWWENWPMMEASLRKSCLCFSV